MGSLTIGLEATEGLLGLQQAGGGPSERHLGDPPAFDVARDLAHRAERVLDDVGARQRALQLLGQAEADDGEDLLEALQDREPATPGSTCSRRRARSRKSRSALSASSCSQAWRSAFLTLACRCSGRRSMMLRPLWTRQRWMAAATPKVLRIALLSAFADAVIALIDDPSLSARLGTSRRSGRISPPGRHPAQRPGSGSGYAGA